MSNHSKTELDSLIGLPVNGMRLTFQCLPPHLQNVERLLEGTGISRDDWDYGQALMTWKHVRLFTSNVLALNPPSDLPLRTGLLASPNIHGAVGMAAMTSEDVDNALHMFEQFINTRSQVFEMRYIKATVLDGNACNSMMFSFLPPEDTGLRFNIQAILAGAYCSVKFLAGGILQDAEIHFKWPKPDNWKDYETAFDGNKVVFDAPAYAIHIPLTTGSKTIISSDKTLHAIAVQQCESQVQSMYVKGSTAQWVLSQLSMQRGHLLTLEQLAEMMKISSRTLLRRLKLEGVSFQELQDLECSRRASELLKAGQSVAAVAEQLGYAEPVSFRRAFKRWFGVAPSEFRMKG
ncbi:MAG: AraC family transcriptional regulator ligand-binding domain-containing protein [Limnobacter sp.]|nr:AraC family transcriptional regulator ligand-binding domain-containing protein [Limnobacter sp.]